MSQEESLLRTYTNLSGIGLFFVGVYSTTSRYITFFSWSCLVSTLLDSNEKNVLEEGGGVTGGCRYFSNSDVTYFVTLTRHTRRWLFTHLCYTSLFNTNQNEPRPTYVWIVLWTKFPIRTKPHHMMPASQLFQFGELPPSDKRKRSSFIRTSNCVFSPANTWDYFEQNTITYVEHPGPNNRNETVFRKVKGQLRTATVVTAHPPSRQFSRRIGTIQMPRRNARYIRYCTKTPASSKWQIYPDTVIHETRDGQKWTRASR